MNKQQQRVSAVSRTTARKLRKIAAQITAKPRGFDMRSWVSPAPVCRTTCCIAGQAVINEGVRAEEILLHDGMVPLGQLPAALVRKAGYRVADNIGDVPLLARAALGITKSQATRLFCVSEWPEPFLSAVGYRPSGDVFTPVGIVAHVAAARIEHFIETGE